jgi:parallel beta-helix repeat protein
MRGNIVIMRASVVVVACVILGQIWAMSSNVNADNIIPVDTPTILTDQVASWPMDEGSGLYAYDASGNGNTGTLTNGLSWIDCLVGKALAFDGSFDYVACGGSLTGTVFTSLSVQAWIKPEESTGSRYIFYDGSDGEFALWQNENACGITVKLNGVAEKWVVAPESIEYNMWQLVTGVFTGSELQIYVNGVLRNTVTVPANGLYNPGGTFDPTIGAWTASASNHLYYFKGAIDDVNVWSRVLTAAEIGNEFNTSWRNYYESGVPIRIDSNDDFNIAHGVTSGNGTESNPWIINNRSIDGDVCGIYIGNTTEYYTIKDCIIYDCHSNIRPWGYGAINLYNSTNGTVYGNVFSDNSRSVYLHLANNNKISGNVCNYPGGGIELYSSSFNVIIDNTLDGGGIQISGFPDISYYNSIIKNTIYRSGISAPQMAEGTTIENNEISFSEGTGIYVGNAHTDHMRIVNNRISSNNGSGIYFMQLNHHQEIINNTISNNHNDGIYFSDESNNCVVSNNTLINNWHGIFMDEGCYDNKILDNTVSDNDFGIFLFSDWSITENNKIYHNDIINNVVQAYDNGNNFWNDSYPAGGNYWSDYMSFDYYNGPNQDLSGADGIGDTPYLFTNGQDYYPHIVPIGWSYISPFNTGTSEGIIDDWEYVSPAAFVMDASPDGGYAVIGDINGYLKLFHVDSNVPLWSLNIGTTIQNVSIAENGNYIGVVVDNKPRLYTGYGDLVFSGMEMGEIESTIDLTWEGKHAFVGYTNTMNMDLWRMAGGVSQIRCQNGDILPSTPIIAGGGNYVANFHASSPRVPVWNGTTVLESQTLGGWQNPLFTFIDPLGNVNDIAMSYDGNTIVAGSSSSDYGIINKTGWYWHTSAPSSIIDIDISNDGKIITALDSSGNLQIVYQNKTIKSIAGTFSNAELTGDGRHIICSDVTGTTGLSIYDTNLILVEQNTTIGNYDMNTLYVGDNGRHIWGISGLTLHHVEVIPHVNLTYAAEYFAAGYEHVNETTQFILSGYSVAADYKIKYELDGRGWVEYSGPFNLTGLLPGPHKIKYHIEDSDGYKTENYQIAIWLDSYGFYSDTEARLTYLETQISNIWAAILSINSTIQTLNNSMNYLGLRVTNLTANLTSIAYNLSQHWNFTDNMTIDIDNLELKISVLQQNVSDHWNYTTNMTLTVGEMQANITIIQQNASDHWNFTDDMVILIDGIETNVTHLQNDCLALFQNVSNHWNVTDIMNSNIGILQINVLDLQENVTAIWENITSLGLDQKKLWNNVTTLIQRIDSLELNDTYSNQNITRLNNDLALLETSLIGYANNLNALTVRVTGMEANGTATKQELDETYWLLYNTTISLHVAEALIERIHTDITTLENEIEANEDAITRAETSIGMNTAIAVIALILGIIGLILGLLSMRKIKEPMNTIKEKEEIGDKVD